MNDSLFEKDAPDVDEVKYHARFTQLRNGTYRCDIMRYSRYESINNEPYVIDTFFTDTVVFGKFKAKRKLKECRRADNFEEKVVIIE